MTITECMYIPEGTTGDTVNVYNNTETQTKKVNKNDQFIEVGDLHVRAGNGEVEGTVGSRVESTLTTVKD